MARKQRKSKDEERFRKFFVGGSYKRNLGHMKLLISQQEFQTIVAGTRARLNIPPGGHLSDAASQKWTYWMDAESDRVMNARDFIQQEMRIKEKARSHEIGVRMAQKQMNLHYDKSSWNHLWNRINFIVEQFGLPLHFNEYIRAYIVRGIIDAPQHNYKGGFYRAGAKPSEERYIPVEVYTQLTWAELKELKNWLDDAGKKKLPRYKTLRAVDRNLDFEQWLSQQKHEDIITGKSYRITASETAKEFLGSTKKGAIVRGAMRDLKKLRGKRFPNVRKTEQ